MIWVKRYIRCWGWFGIFPPLIIVHVVAVLLVLSIGLICGLICANLMNIHNRVGYWAHDGKCRNCDQYLDYDNWLESIELLDCYKHNADYH